VTDRPPDPGKTWHRLKPTSILNKNYRHYTVPLCLGPAMSQMRAMHPTLDTGAGISLIRVSELPTNWEDYAIKDARTPDVVDASGKPLRILSSINLIVDSGVIQMISTFHVVRDLAVPAILGTRFINQHVEAIYPKLNKVYWAAPSYPTSVCMPILRARTSKHTVPQSKVRLAKRTSLPPYSEVVAWANCDVEGMVLVSTSTRLHQKHQVVLANGLASIQPGVPVEVRLCNIGPTERKLKKGAVLGYAETYEGPVVATIDEKPKPLAEKPPPTIESVNLSDAPKNMHTKIRKMLDKHKAMWDGTLGSIRATVHRIETEDGTSPIHQAPYRTGLRKREIILKCVNAMLKQKVIQPSHSEWSSPVVVVPKKNGEPRFCVDNRRLNFVTKKDTYPVPMMDDCLDSLGEAQYFSTLHCTARYWQVPLNRTTRRRRPSPATTDCLSGWRCRSASPTRPPPSNERWT